MQSIAVSSKNIKIIHFQEVHGLSADVNNPLKYQFFTKGVCLEIDT